MGNHCLINLVITLEGKQTKRQKNLRLNRKVNYLHPVNKPLENSAYLMEIKKFSWQGSHSPTGFKYKNTLIKI